VDLGLLGKVAIVTGASMGIGKGIAGALAAEGAFVALVARRSGPLEEAGLELSARGSEAIGIIADVNEPGAEARIVQETIARFDRIDILVNNAGGFYNGNVMTVQDAQWHEAFEYNVVSIARLSRAVVPHMRSAGEGRIVNISSIAGLQVGFSFSYSVAKDAAIALTKQMAEQLAPDRITVNCICPGLIRTPAWEPWAVERAAGLGIPVDEFFERQAAPVPLKRWGTSEEVGDLVAFLASSRAAYITGATMTIDGGYVRAHH
jgi:NAD(P)-dependent dehydrogenase (short-subunit alcohol dehydrogenase family)